MSHGCNSGLSNAYNLVKPDKEQFPELGWADLFQVRSGMCMMVGAGRWVLAGGWASGRHFLLLLCGASRFYQFQNLSCHEHLLATPQH